MEHENNRKEKSLFTFFALLYQTICRLQSFGSSGSLSHKCSYQLVSDRSLWLEKCEACSTGDWGANQMLPAGLFLWFFFFFSASSLIVFLLSLQWPQCQMEQMSETQSDILVSWKYTDPWSLSFFQICSFHQSHTIATGAGLTGGIRGPAERSVNTEDEFNS